MSLDRRRMGGYMSLRDAIDQLFEDSVISPGRPGGSGNYPHVDMHINDEDVSIAMAIPGARPEDIDISVTGDVVTVSGEIHKEKRSEKTQPYVEEIWRGRFQRSFQLPVAVDPNKAEANFEHGMLKLVLPKSEATKPRKIQVRGEQTTIESRGSSDGK